MKNNSKYKLILLLIGTISILILLSFKPLKSDSQNSIDELNNRLILRWEHLIHQTEILKNVIRNEKETQKKWNGTLTKYRKLRDAFKAFEYLGENNDPTLFKVFLNGSPLPKMEENSYEPKIIEPKGLQKIDELISENRLENNTQLYSLLAEFENNLKANKPVKVYERDFFNASRIELIRIFTLSLSGFDTPGSYDFVNDCKISIATLKLDLNLFKNSIQIDKYNNCISKYTGLENYLKNTNRKKLDYVKIVREYIDPLFLELLNIQLENDIEFPEEYLKFPSAINLHAKSIFDAKLLNSSYFSRVPNEYNNKEVIELGKFLFFDPVLSNDGKRACASCHQPDKGFSDQLVKSYAFDKQEYLERNTPGLINAIFSTRFFHDMRASSFEDQMEHVVHNKKEFNSDYFSIINNLKEIDEYKEMFKKCFPKEKETLIFKNVQFAIAAYIQSLVGLNSEFDKYIRKEKTEINTDAKEGFNIFIGKGKCAICHFAPLFNGTVPPLFLDSESEVLGVFENPKIKIIDKDKGRGNALLKEKVDFYQYSFKTPTIRNTKITFPYMHNGNYSTLEQVIDFYNKGGAVGQKLKLDNQTLPAKQLKLSKKEINQLIAFINSLTDTNGLTKKPAYLPFTNDLKFKNRVVGGEY
jgi:cytochrome c peroxidase